MISSKALEVLATFSQTEQKEFVLFIRSPYFNSNKNIIKLFDVLKTNTGKDITEEYAYGKVFPGKKYNYGIMKNLLSELYKLCERFLIVNYSGQNKGYRFEGQMALAAVYDDRFLDNNYKKLINGLKESLKDELIGFDRYQMLSHIEESIYYFNANRSNNKDLQEAVYNEMIYTICDFYRKFSRNLWKIDINIDNINTQYEKDLIELLKKNINFDGIAEGMAGINKIDYDNLIMNNLLIKLVTEPENTDEFYKIKKHLFENIDNYTNYERYSLISKILSYCATAFGLGKKEFMRESIEIKKLMMKKVRFNEDGLGAFNYVAFIETVRAFLYLDETKQAENFTKNFTHWLEEDKKDLAFHLSMAYIEEAKGNYEDAINCLTLLKPLDHDTKISIRYIYLRLYYSMDHFEPGLSLVNSFRNYLKEARELDSPSKKRHLETLKIFEKLLKIKCTPEKYTMFDLDQLKNTINSEIVLGAPWLLQKADELKDQLKT